MMSTAQVSYLVAKNIKGAGIELSNKSWFPAPGFDQITEQFQMMDQYSFGLSSDLKHSGTYPLRGEDCIRCVTHALKVGYRHIDTAEMYGNEREIGKAIKQSGIPREEIILTSKFTGHGYDHVLEVSYICLQQFNTALAKFDLKYIDLYLIHWPGSGTPKTRADSWRALEHLYEKGLCKSIGVSNYTERHLAELFSTCKYKPHVNQVEFHPQLVQLDLLETCKKNQIQMVSYMPLGAGHLPENSTLKEIAQKCRKTAAQLILRWHLQHGTIPIPKSGTLSRIEENTNIFDFEISSEDMAKIDKMHKGKRYDWDPTNVI